MDQKDYQSFFHKDFCGIAQLVQNVLLPALTLNQESYTNKETQPLAQQELGNANIQSAILSGTIDINGAQIDVWDVTVKPECRLHIARQAIRDCFRSYTEHYSGAFIIFHYENCANQPWRLSWLSLGKNNQDVNNAKRYTYLCGKDYACRTIAERFVELETTKTKTLDSITRAFDVEALSDEFFSEYRVLYNDIVQYITGQRYIKKNNQWECNPKEVDKKAPGYNNIYLQFARLYDNNEEQAVKAVRDYVKKLMGRLVFIQFVQKKNWLKINDISTTNFLLDIFNAVESEYRDDFIESVLEKVVYMLLNQEHTDYGKIGNVKIDVPFLNGGLFEPDIYDAGTKVRLPKEFFHNPQNAEVKRTLSDSQLRAEDKFFSQCGILDLFYQYNFTIDENDPNDAEIGVDPEMLGKIFENLLEDNKDKGAFYTHKEIVNYMCEESLIAYLNTKVPGIENAIRQWVTANENSDAINMHQKELQDALQKVKICDPAVGSGAFPMGLLNLLLRLRGTTHMTEAERCEIKKEIIQNNIYGVDIEKGAVDIARLRFWLSIVVDLDNPTALPNMDFKIMQGNSLLEWYEGVDLSGMSLNEQAKKKTKKGQAYEQTFAFDEQQSLDNIQNVIQEYYGTDDHQKKVELRDLINSNVKSYIRNLKGCTPEIQQKLETLPIPNDKFFLWHIYFKEVFDNGGFDILIGNPPYGVSIKGTYRDEVVKALGRVPDFEIYYFFFELAKMLVKADGLLSYIVPNTWLFNAFAKTYRQEVLKSWRIEEILDCSKFKIFESATVRNTINLWRKGAIEGSLCGYRNTLKATDFLSLVSEERVFLTMESLLQMNQNWALAFRLSPNIVTIVNKVSNSGKPLSDYFATSQGLIAYDKYQGQSQEIIKNRAYHFDSYREGLKKCLWGEDVKRYSLQWNGKEWIDYCEGIANPRKPDFFVGKRLLVREITNPSIFAVITSDELYNDPSVIIVKDSDQYSLEVVLAILNSKLATFYHFNHSPKATKGSFPKILVQDIKDFPLPSVPNEIQGTIVQIVTSILSAKKMNLLSDTTAKEHEIDQLVYELYGLTEEEIAIVEGTK